MSNLFIKKMSNESYTNSKEYKKAADDFCNSIVKYIEKVTEIMLDFCSKDNADNKDTRKF